MKKTIKKKRLKTIKCSFFFMPIILILIIFTTIGIIFFSNVEINFFILTPILVGVILVPFQAIFFDLFDTTSQYFLFKEKDLLEVNVENEVLNKLQETAYQYMDIVSIEFKFKYMPCIETIMIKFNNNKKIELINFYFSNDDFEWMKKFLLDRLPSSRFNSSI
jgi:hypothetical protein